MSPALPVLNTILGGIRRAGGGGGGGMCILLLAYLRSPFNKSYFIFMFHGTRGVCVQVVLHDPPSFQIKAEVQRGELTYPRKVRHGTRIKPRADSKAHAFHHYTRLDPYFIPSL